MAIHEKQNLFAKGSPSRKDSLRPEGDVAQATEGGWLSSDSETERFIAIFKNSAYRNGIFAICSLRMLLVH